MLKYSAFSPGHTMGCSYDCIPWKWLSQQCGLLALLAALLAGAAGQTAASAYSCISQ